MELQSLNRTKVHTRLLDLSQSLNTQYLNLTSLTDKIVTGLYPNVSTRELDTLASETSASLTSHHPDYGTLAARICISQNHKLTPERFSWAMASLHDEGRGFLDSDVASLVSRRAEEIDRRIRHDRDFDLTYFGYKTLERAYLLKDDRSSLLERPQYLFMRVSLGLHCVQGGDEEENLRLAFETYDCMSRGLFTHASPTLFHCGTTHPQLSSCFLLRMESDSIKGIYDTLASCAMISKSAGGIGLSVHNIRARGTLIKGTRGRSNGLVPMLRVFDVTSRYVDQGGGKRPGAFAVYLEPWHADIFDVLNLKKNHGKEEQRARDLFYGLWIPDLFMERVKRDEKWSLMCPDKCKGLQDCYGSEFETLYKKYETEGKAVKTVRARELWHAILDAQIETGTPYMLYKDAINEKNNQKNLGTIQCSNLCTEILQYTNENETAVCNLASICLPKFVHSPNANYYGSIDPSRAEATFNHTALHHVTKIITRNLNKIIDINQYPTPQCETSNKKHRPIGIGVSGLADVFLRMGMPFDSPEAKALNEAIFETIYHAALEASADLAAVQGSYETFRGSPAAEGILQFDLWKESPSAFPSHDRGEPYEWEELKARIQKVGLRNSLLVAPMPTASTSQILGVNECFEPFSSNLYLRRVKAGEFVVANPHLLQDLTSLDLWTPEVRNQLMRDGGSVQNIACVPDRLKKLYKTVWELKMKDIIDMAADRGRFVDQSQSLNLFLRDPTVEKLTAMHFYGWKKGLKTGMYYLRSRPAVNAIQYTVDKEATTELEQNLPTQDPEDEACLSCQA